jgi:UDPglucose--hexose-1-phosphate uridylyltransferase
MTAAERRFDPLSGRHVLVSTGRLARPWQGQLEPPAATRPPSHDAECHLCPGNLRASQARNPDYRGVFIFDNDYPALTPEVAGEKASPDPLFATEPVRGRARVLCYSEDHGASLADLGPAGLRSVIDAWSNEVEVLQDEFAHVQIFENRGAMMGASSPHPHGQIWATNHVPDEVAAEDQQQRRWLAERHTVLMTDIAAREADGDREVTANTDWLAIVPFWAVWPFETLLLPRFPVTRLTELTSDRRDSLAQLLGDLMARYDALFSAPMPYSMGWHGAPGRDPAPWWTLHAHFYPPLLRSASVRKHMVGFELLAEAQRDLTPEEAAERLRAVR